MTVKRPQRFLCLLLCSLVALCLTALGTRLHLATDATFNAKNPRPKPRAIVQPLNKACEAQPAKKFAPSPEPMLPAPQLEIVRHGVTAHVLTDARHRVLLPLFLSTGPARSPPC